MNNAEVELRSWVQKRGAIKAKVTRFQSFLQNLDQDSSLTQVILRKAKVEPLWQEFEAVQSQIELLSQGDSDESQSEEREAFEGTYFTALSIAEEHIKRMQPVHETTAAAVNQRQEILGNQLQVKLPTIHLPHFNGAYDQWHVFVDTFQSLIHDNVGMPEIQKFHYLRSALIEEAAQVISSLEISALNYNVAWELLKERYENKRVIVQNHVTALFDLPVITKESHIALRQLMDTASRHLRALKSLNQPTETWDTLLIHMITSKFDTQTRREWESTIDVKELPNMKDLNRFLQNHCHLLQSLEKKDCVKQVAKVKQPVLQSTQSRVNSRQFQTQSYATSNNLQCHKCEQPHLIYQCGEFLKLSISDRIQEIKRLNLCLNCLRPNHRAQQCNSGTCRTCSRKHNTLLHLGSKDLKGRTEPINSNHVSTEIGEELGHTVTNTTTQPSSNQISRVERGFPEQTEIVMHSTPQHIRATQVILSTALINIYGKDGHLHQGRALLDSGSQSNFVTEDFAQRLGLTLHPISLPVTGVSKVVTIIQHQLRARIQSRFPGYQGETNFLLLPQITDRLPTVPLAREKMAIPQTIKLADPHFDIPSSIDLLLGAEIFWELMCLGQLPKTKHRPTLQKTKLGWILAGRCSSQSAKGPLQALHCRIYSGTDLQDSLSRFWIQEELPKQRHLSLEETICEEQFATTTTRDAEGRFIVKLPLRAELNELGESRSIAISRFRHTERRLRNNANFREQYCQGIQDYIKDGHMELVPEPEVDKPRFPSHYLPHHAVFKESSLTTKLRIVFDGSASTDSGVSLNDLLRVGPTIQEELFTIVLRFRMHKHVMTADIKKMYRQVWVHPDQIDLQRILWREPSQSDQDPKPIQTYRLKTVTFGTSSAPFLATRCLAQTAHEAVETHPVAAEIILRDFYMDDLLTGGDSRETLKQLKKDITHILEKGCFELHKWNSDCSEIRESDLLQTQDPNSLNIANTKATTSILGLRWNSSQDTLAVRVQEGKPSQKGTKRLILAHIASIFDPLGVIGPVTITAKTLLQELWQFNIGWDDAIPIHLFTKWQRFHMDLQYLREGSIPRRVISIQIPTAIQVHGFCDASEVAYGACIFIRAVNQRGETSSHLLCAKSRVAPLKTVSIPRLELCSALLLAKLVNKVVTALSLDYKRVTYWTDSMVTLDWIRASPHRWKTFVANRVSEIQDLSDQRAWRHIRTNDNPADLLSRGISAKQLAHHSLWWNGPSWILQPEDHWPTQPDIRDAPEESAEARTIVALVTVTQSNPLFTRFSTFNKLVNVLAYCFRFQTNCQMIQTRLNGPLQIPERQKAITRLIHLAQKESFEQDVRNLKASGHVHASSHLAPLAPFLDEQQIIRVGGRLQQAAIEPARRHPVVLPKNHPLTNLIVKHEHLRQLHAGPQATLAAVRDNYWIISGQQLVKKVIHQCLRCFRLKPRSQNPLMGTLPCARVNPNRPFAICGVDFCGPFMLREGGPKSKRRVKAYGSIFVCFATRAVHIELVSDLTSEAFLAALRRFIGRRGKPQEIHSDNATNFTGANRELTLLYNQYASEQHQRQISASLTKEGISWKFIPPNSPHFGGIWEAAVKSTKHHLRRVVGDASLSFEELATVLIQIEACLNSRPISPMSNDPNEILALTPGHFLIGGPLTSLQEPSLIPLKINKLSRWQRTLQLTQHFWARWSREYLSQLQSRNKWNKMLPPPQVGTLVILRDDRTPPLSWPLGRIIQLHPGSDGVSRVATVKTSSGLLKRALARLCVLPIDTTS